MFRHDTIYIHKGFFPQHLNKTSDATEVNFVNYFLESSWLTRGSRGSWTHASERSVRRDRPHTSEPACWWSWRSEEKVQKLHVHILFFLYRVSENRMYFIVNSTCILYLCYLFIYYRSNADAFSEAVVSLDVFIQFFDSLSSQRGAVVGFVHV